MNAKKFLETKGIKDTLYYDGEWIKGDLSDLLEEYAAIQVKTCNKPAVIKPFCTLYRHAPYELCSGDCHGGCRHWGTSAK